MNNHCWLRLGLVLLFGVAGNALSQQKKTPVFIECRAEGVMLHTDGTQVKTEDLNTYPNALERLLDRVLNKRESERLVVFVRPGSVKVYRKVRASIGKRPVDVTFEPLEAGAKVGNPPPHAPTTGSPVFFECRNNEVFVVDKEGLNAQVLQIVPANGPKNNLGEFLKMVQARPVTNTFYKVNPEWLCAAVIALEPYPNAHGDSLANLEKPDGQFRSALSRLSKRDHYVAFFVRDDSFAAFCRARELAEQLGFGTGWELLADGELIKFGGR
jgi:hypothetical protein